MLDPRRENVRQFYDTFGWQKETDGRYRDGAMADDWRPVTAWYRRACNRRVQGMIAARGKLLLDAASGAVQLDDYVAFSAGYERRVCVDFSRRALLEARSRLPDKALCVQADVTALPFRDGAFDACVSLHTIYHVPPDDQGDAFGELHRTLRGGATGVVVYARDRRELHPLPEWLASWLLGKERFARRLRPTGAPLAPPPLYFHPLPVSAIRDLLGRRAIPHTLGTWRSISVALGRLVLPDNAAGRALLRALFWAESVFPRWFADRASYPLFVIRKRAMRERAQDDAVVAPAERSAAA